MNSEHEKLIKKLDSVNTKYILHCDEIVTAFERAERYLKDGKMALAKAMEQSAVEKVKLFGCNRLTPDTVKTGDGVTVNYWSDRHAATVIKITPKTVMVQRDKAVLNPNFHPEFIPGGFAAHCINQCEQDYTYEPDQNGEILTFHWSDKYQRYGQPGNLTLSKWRHEFYDYNF